VIWYFAAAPPVNPPLAAVVIAQITTAGTGVGSPPPTFDLMVIAADGTTSKASAVPFHYGTRPTAGAWCTMPRVNTPPAGIWPALSEGAVDYVMHDMTPEQRTAWAEMVAAKLAAQDQPAQQPA
jgi:hypothetical protein